MVRNDRVIAALPTPVEARALLIWVRDADTLLDRIDTHLRSKHPAPLLVRYNGVYEAHVLDHVLDYVLDSVAGERYDGSVAELLEAKNSFVILPGERSDSRIAKFLPRLYAPAPYSIYRSDS